MSAAAAGARTRPAAARPDALIVYRDDGPLARALARVLAPRVPVPAPGLLVAAAAAVLAAAAIAGGEASRAAAGGVIVWVIACGAVSRGRPLPLKARWVATPLLRVAEYAGLLWIAALEGPDAYPAAFALLAALAFRHYDLTYRLRHRAATPARWVDAASAGWEGRLAVAYVLLLAGALPTGYYVAAAVLGALFVVESALGWIQVGETDDEIEEDDAA